MPDQPDGVYAPEDPLEAKAVEWAEGQLLWLLFVLGKNAISVELLSPVIVKQPADMAYLAHALNNLNHRDWMIKLDAERVMLTEVGRAEALRRSGITTYLDLQNLDAAVRNRLEHGLQQLIQQHLGPLEDRLASAAADVSRLETDLKDRMADAKAQVQGLESRVTEGQQAIEDKLRSAERDFYSRIFPFFAVFVSAFALIMSGALSSIRLASAQSGLELAETWSDLGWAVLSSFSCSWDLVWRIQAALVRAGFPHGRAIIGVKRLSEGSGQWT